MRLVIYYAGLTRLCVFSFATDCSVVFGALNIFRNMVLNDGDSINLARWRYFPDYPCCAYTIYKYVTISFMHFIFLAKYVCYTK